ncbi:MAG TPA: hypothetical protein V6D10_00115 [Trichocoleus sp.]|jgi:hypothetical protein
MLSLLTYGATFGIAANPKNIYRERSSSPEPDSIDSFKPDAQEQHATKGGGIGWLKRLFQRQI